jgi:RND family efflux transporter MFP subunit
MRTRTRSILPALLAAALAPAPAPAQLPPAKVVVSPVIEREVRAGQVFVGTVVPLRTSTVGSAVSGRVDELLVNEGDRVEKGQPLARLRTKMIEAELAAARADLAMRKAELTELENGYLPDEIEQARSRHAAAEASARFRKLRHERLAATTDTSTRDEIDEALALSDQAVAAVREAKATLKLLEDGPRKERIAQAQARFDSQEAEVARLEEQLDRHSILAPFDGHISAEHTEVGQWLLQGAPIAEVVEISSVDVEVPVPEDYIGFLRKGDRVRVEVGAIADEVFMGEVALIVPRANERTRTFPVKVRVRNREEDDHVLLKAGMFARVMFPVGRTQPALLASKDAIVLGGPSPRIFIFEPDAADASRGKVRLVPVELGVAEGGLIQMKGDLAAGESVVVEGNERLRPGQEVLAAAVKEGRAP